MNEKPTLIILPGWGGSQETWAQFIDLAKQEYNVLCIDLPCFGTEPCPKEAWGVDQYANFVYKKIISDSGSFDKLRTGFRISDLILLGHSFGGQVATKVVAEHPELFSRLILIGAAVIRPSRKIRRFILGKLAKVGKFFFSFPAIEDHGLWFKKVFYTGLDARDYAATAGIKREIFKKIIREDLSALLLMIKLPTLVIWGKYDTYVPLRDGKKIGALLPNSRFHLVNNGRHGLHLQDPKELLLVIQKFLKTEN